MPDDAKPEPHVIPVQVHGVVGNWASGRGMVVLPRHDAAPWQRTDIVVLPFEEPFQVKPGEQVLVSSDLALLAIYSADGNPRMLYRLVDGVMRQQQP
jgi:hypothetical protein